MKPRLQFAHSMVCFPVLQADVSPILVFLPLCRFGVSAAFLCKIHSLPVDSVVHLSLYVYMLLAYLIQQVLNNSENYFESYLFSFPVIILSNMIIYSTTQCIVSLLHCATSHKQN